MLQDSFVPNLLSAFSAKEAVDYGRVMQGGLYAGDSVPAVRLPLDSRRRTRGMVHASENDHGESLEFIPEVFSYPNISSDGSLRLFHAKCNCNGPIFCRFLMRDCASTAFDNSISIDNVPIDG